MRKAFPVLAILMLFLLALTLGSAGLEPKHPQVWSVFAIFIMGLAIAFIAGDEA